MKTILIILDGLGISPLEKGNAVLGAKMPFFEELINKYPHTLLAASGKEVGLSWGEMGNSEIGHLNLGSGRVVEQDLPRINLSIENGSFFKNPNLISAFEFVKKNQSNLHLMGLCSDGGVHSHLNHLLALLEMAKKQDCKNIYLHLFTDGRDASPKSAQSYLTKIQEKIAKLGFGKIATLCGRYFAMDRDKHWDRTQKAYEAIVLKKAPQASNLEEAINSSYQSGKTDEFMEPIVFDNTGIKSNDAVIFFNFRTDRAKQLVEAIINPNFVSFNRPYLKDLLFVGFTNFGFEPTPLVKIAFFPPNLKNVLADLLSQSQKRQFHLAETEKYAHVTYFFNGGQEEPFSGEERKIVPSPDVATYDLKPEMSADEVTSEFIKVIESDKYDFIVTNYANPDMVGHTGNYKAAVVACETVDKCLSEVVPKALAKGYQIIVTADHGNVEQMINPQTGQPDTEHSTNPVPLILISDKEQNAGNVDIKEYFSSSPVGVLADVTATIIASLELQKPSQMNGLDISKNI